MIELSAKELVKSYGATRALSGLTLRLTSGEVVGIAGPNGAGKSTLTRILAGEERPDSGMITLLRDGVATTDLQHRVALVHQEPQLWPNLTALENLAVGRESWTRRGVRSQQDVLATFGMLGISQFAEFQLSDLSLATQQRVEIARAIISDADVFLFDEPNSALTEDESQALFTTMSRLANGGKIVALITHRLNDFVRCCNRVVILRDGRIGDELISSGVTEASIAAKLMTGVGSGATTGRQTAAVGLPDPGGQAPWVLRLDRYSDPAGRFRPVSMALRPGVITVLAGVEGSGARELVRAIALRAPKADGSFELKHQAKIAFVAASRQHTVFPNMSVGENLVSRLSRAIQVRGFPLLSGRKIAQRAATGLGRYGIKALSALAPVTSLSGGNQQKVAVGAALEQDPDLLVLEEPTRGVDVASKHDIYNLVRQAAQSGKSVLLFCTEVPEMFAIADFVVVMARGAIVGTFGIESFASVTRLAHMLAELESAEPGSSRPEELAMSD